jgi:RNA polymerase sigma-70 factor (ECF subfamily)
MNEKEFNQTVVELTNRVCRFVDKLLMEEEVAKDIVQEAFIRLWENRKNIPKEKAKSWLFTTSYRMALDHSKQRSKFSEIGDYRIREEKANFDLKKVIDDSLMLLSDVQRSIVLLRDMEGYTYEEISEILQLSESQVKVYLFRARTKIKDYIKDLTHVL